MVSSYKFHLFYLKEVRQSLTLPEVFETWDSLVMDEINNPMSKHEPDMFTDERQDNMIISFSEFKELKIQDFK